MRIKLKKLKYYFISLAYFIAKETRLSKMHLKDKIRNETLITAGTQLLNPRKLIYDESCITRKARKIPNSKLEIFRKRAEQVNKFKKWNEIKPNMEIVKLKERKVK